MWRHPKYYKELRKRNKTGVTATTKRDIGHSQELSFGFPPPVNSDRVISKQQATASSTRAPGPGLKQQAASDSQVVNQVKLSSQSQASSDKPQATETQAASDKHQALRCKHQASSRKRQAPQ